MKKKYLFVAAVSVVSCMNYQVVKAQTKIGDVPGASNPNAYLQLGESTGNATKGLLLPKVALTGTSSAAPMTGHVTGMHVYNTATAGTGATAVTPGEYYNDGAQWVRVGTGGATTNNNNIYGPGAPAGTGNPGDIYTDTLSTSNTRGQQWVYQNNTWVNYTSSSKTAWNINGTTNDANGDKLSRIYRNGYIGVGGHLGGNGDAAYDFSKQVNAGNVPLAVVAPGYTAPAADAGTTALRLGRPGTNGTKWPASVDLSLGSYGSTVNAESRLDISLGNAGTAMPDTKVMSLLGNGNVGIGTTVPLSKFHIVRGADGGGFTAANVGTADVVVESRANNAPARLLLGSNNGVGGTTAGNNIEFWANTFGGGLGQVAKINTISTQGSSAGKNYGNLVFSTSNNTLAPAEAMRISSDGNVGIGTTVPANKLHLAGNNAKLVIDNGASATSNIGIEFRNGDVTASQPKSAIISKGYNSWKRADMLFVLDGAADDGPHDLNTDTKMTIKAESGNVGIGTATPASKLTVGADNNSGFNFGNQILIQGATTPNQQLLLGYNTTDDYGTIQANKAGIGTRPLALQPFGGNVGIGTGTPAAKLDVAGNVKIADGTQGAGKVLTSDANGVASWQSGAGKPHIYNGQWGNVTGTPTAIFGGATIPDGTAIFIKTTLGYCGANTAIFLVYSGKLYQVSQTLYSNMGGWTDNSNYIQSSGWVSVLARSAHFDIQLVNGQLYVSMSDPGYADQFFIAATF